MWPHKFTISGKIPPNPNNKISINFNLAIQPISTLIKK